MSAPMVPTTVTAAPSGAVPGPAGSDDCVSRLWDLVSGKPVLLGGVDLLKVANAQYVGPAPDVDLGSLTAAWWALDYVSCRVAEERAVGGTRARSLLYDLFRWVAPFLLEHRAGDVPQPVADLRITDLRAFAGMLAGDGPMPAATAAAKTLGRLAVTCVWLDIADAAAACDLSTPQMAALAGPQVPLRLTRDGQPVVRAVDLRRAGLLVEPERAHGLGAGTAKNVLDLLKRAWQHAVDHGVDLPGRPESVKAKKPLPARRTRTPRGRSREYVTIERLLEVMPYLHPVHQVAVCLERLAGIRASEAYDLNVDDYGGGTAWAGGIGGSRRLVLDEDGTFTWVDRRAGTKGSAEGMLPAGTDPKDATAGLRGRLVPLIEPLERLLDEVAAVFHTDPVTGLVDPQARLIPGLRADDAGGYQALSAALRVACEEAPWSAGPRTFTAHDLRASLNTDLLNSGLSQREVRLLLGHESEDGQSLDVNAAHYDLGADPATLARVRDAIAATLPAGLTDLRVPTTRLPQFGTGTRMRKRQAEIEAALLACGWYAPDRQRTARVEVSPGPTAGSPMDEAGAGPAPMQAAGHSPATASVASVTEQDPSGPELTVKVSAQLLGISGTQVKRLLEAGQLLGRKVPRGGRDVWLIAQAEVDKELARRVRTRLTDLADELGMSYPQVWALVDELGLREPGRVPGEAVRLDPADADQVRQEARTRAAKAAEAMTHAEAAAHLDLPEPMVQTLVRRGDLQPCPGPGRTARVTRASVEDYRRHFPTPPAVAAEEPVVPISDLRTILGLKRNAVSELVCSRQLAVVKIRRRQHVGSASIRAYLDRHPIDGALERLAVLQVSQ